MRRVLVFLCVVALLCVAPARGADAAGEAPAIEVLDPGAEPRERLRIDVEEGDEFSASFELRQQIEQEIDGEPSPLEPVPAIREDLLVRVQDVTSKGRVTYTFEVQKVEIVDATGVAPELVDELEDDLATLSDVEGDATVNARGVFLESNIDIPDDVPATVRDLLEQLRQQLPSLTVPFPREAVGVGARWRAPLDVTFAGIESENANEYALLEQNGSRLVVGVSVRQRATPQDVDSPSAPEGADVRLESSRFDGSGTVTLDLTTLVPAASTATLEGRQRFTIEADGDRQTLRQSASLGITIGPGPGPG